MPIKKPTKYRSSQKMRNYIANVEAKHFAEQNRRFGGDAIAAKELELNQALGDSLSYVDNDTYDAMLSYWYNTKRDSGKAMIDAWRRYYANPTDGGFYAFKNSFNAGYDDEQNPGLRDRRNFERSLIKPIHDLSAPESQLPYRDSNYDMNRAVQLGYGAGEDGHYPSRDYITGDILKYPSHPTFGKALYADLGEGYLPVKRKKGKLKANTQPTPMRQWMDNTFKQPVIPFK